MSRLPTSPPPVGLQLYSVRAEMDLDTQATLERVAALGFAGVEAAGTHGLAPAEFRQRLDDLGLTLISAMVGLDPDGLSAQTLEFACALGTPRLVVNAWPQQFATSDAITALTASMRAASTQADAVGIALGYHNHFWEFQPSAAGACPMLDLATQLDDCFLELDLYWLRSAVAEWEPVLTALADRVRTVHVKDGPGTLPDLEWKNDPMTPAGTGVVPIDAMLHALPRAEWHVVEFDDHDGDIFTAISASRRYLLDHGLSSATTVPS